MQSILRIRVVCLRRRPNSSVSLLTAVDIAEEIHPEPAEQLQDLLDCVWKQEAAVRREERFA